MGCLTAPTANVDGLGWQRAEARGLRTVPNALAVHPRDPKIVAAGTNDGLYLSTDAAASFQQLVGATRVLAQTFDLDGEHLWLSSHSGKTAKLARISLKPGAIATFKKSVFVSVDAGKTWKQIAREGTGKGD
jgi:hypothetical protein